MKNPLKERSGHPPAAVRGGGLPPNFVNPPGSPIEDILKDIPLPRMVPIEQTFDRPVLADAVRAFRESLEASRVLTAVRPGMTVAVGAGSRGITNLPQVTRALLDELKGAGAKPFIFPAMGSHGGATPEGQLGVLERMGFTEQSMGVPFRATMEVVEVGRTPSGLPAYFDANAAGADGIVLVNRIKPHTSFRGRIESGLLKMIVIGLGKQKGAETCHNLGYETMEENLLALGRTALATGKILFGVGAHRERVPRDLPRGSPSGRGDSGKGTGPAGRGPQAHAEDRPARSRCPDHRRSGQEHLRHGV